MPDLLMYKLCFLLAQASSASTSSTCFHSYLKKTPVGLKRGEVSSQLCPEEQAVCGSHCFLQVTHLPQVCGALQSVSCATFSCQWGRMPSDSRLSQQVR